MLKLLSALVAAAGIAGALTFLPGATSARLAASPPAKPEQVSLRPVPIGLGLISNVLVRRFEESRPATIDPDRFTPSASLLRVSDAQILLEKSQMQDW